LVNKTLKKGSFIILYQLWVLWINVAKNQNC